MRLELPMSSRMKFHNDFRQVVEVAYINIDTMHQDRDNNHTKRFAENVFSSALESLHAIVGGETVLLYLNFLDLTKPIPPSLCSLVRNCAVDVLGGYRFQQISKNMQTVICLHFQGGPLTAILTVPNLSPIAAKALIYFMESYLKSEERTL